VVNIVGITGEIDWVNEKYPHYTFSEKCIITVKEYGVYEEFCIPKGFNTDFITGGVFKFLFNDKNFRIAGVVHDLCYHYQLRSFEDSNTLFINLITDSGCPKWKIKICELALKTPIAKKRYYKSKRGELWKLIG